MNILVPEIGGDAAGAFLHMLQRLPQWKEANCYGVGADKYHPNMHSGLKRDFIVPRNRYGRERVDGSVVVELLKIVGEVGAEVLCAPSSEHLTLQLLRALAGGGGRLIGEPSEADVLLSYDKLELGEMWWAHPAHPKWSEGLGVAKPRDGVGSRGVMFVDSELPLDGYVYQSRLNGVELVADYSYGQVVVREVYAQRGGADTVMRVVYNEEVISFVQSIAREIKSRVFNVQMMRDEQGALKVFDFGVRLSGASASCLYVGINLVQKMFDQSGHERYADSDVIVRGLRYI